jgi:signal transduction histidine kinase
MVVEQLKERDRMMKEFINVAAHELKNPITPILVTTQILAKREVDNKITLSKNEFNLIAQNAVKLKRLCEDILDVARIENSGIKLEKTSFNLSDLLRLSIEDSLPLLKPGVQLLFNGPELSVHADRDKIAEVVLNLIHNAIKFTSEGTIELSLTSNSNSEAIVAVKDSGAGIDAQILPRLFSKFATKSEKGTGLGLFISKNIVEAHGGRIWAENNPDNKGATFAFSLPLVQIATTEKTQMA